MHETGLCEAILAAALRRAEGRRVRSVRVRVGGHPVDPLVVETGFQIAAAGTVAEGAGVEVLSEPQTVTCRDCGAVTSAADGLAMVACPRCGGVDVELTAGEDGWWQLPWEPGHPDGPADSRTDSRAGGHPGEHGGDVPGGDLPGGDAHGSLVVLEAIVVDSGQGPGGHPQDVPARPDPVRGRPDRRDAGRRSPDSQNPAHQRAHRQEGPAEGGVP